MAKRSHENGREPLQQTKKRAQGCSLSRESMYADNHGGICRHTLRPWFCWGHLAHFWDLLRRLLWRFNGALISRDCFFEAELFLLLIRHLVRGTGKRQKFEPKQLGVKEKWRMRKRGRMYIYFLWRPHQKLTGVCRRVRTTARISSCSKRSFTGLFLPSFHAASRKHLRPSSKPTKPIRDGYARKWRSLNESIRETRQDTFKIFGCASPQGVIACLFDAT